MKLTFADERLLAVMAHPDDAELLCAGTLGRAKSEGAAAVGVCVMCSGDKGVATSGSTLDLAAIRKGEAAEAMSLLGGTLYWFGAGDGELFDTYENRRALIEVYRRFRPTLVLTHSPEDYHVDHRATYQLAEAATWTCASLGQVTESAPLEKAPALWLADTIDMCAFEPGFFVDVSGQMRLKQRMLACHRSQLARGRDTDFSPLADLMTRQSRARGAQADVEAAEAFRWHQSFKRIRAW